MQDLERVFKIKGNKAGPKTMVLVGVHGNEICGVEALNKIKDTLTIECGEVYFAYGNPRAIEQNVRYTEQNLNRMFVEPNSLTSTQKKSYEYKCAKFLKKYFDKVDVLLDVHASTTPKSFPFIICEKNAFKIAQYLPAHMIVSGFNTVEPGGTDYYMNSKGKIGICFESGYLGDKKSTKNAELAILSSLEVLGHIPRQYIQKQSQKRIRVYKKYFSKTDSFKLKKKFVDFEEVKKGQVIGIDDTHAVTAPKDSVILFANNTTRAGSEIFLLGIKKK
jgi:uncharacterized protein